MPQRGTELGVAEDAFDRGAVTVPVLDGGGFIAGGDIEVGICYVEYERSELFPRNKDSVDCDVGAVHRMTMNE
jgi:hypothetical protein